MNHSLGFFVTGTDTEVGKTLVSGALILKLREQGKKVIGFKPVVAGTYLGGNGQLLNEDLETLRIASNLDQDELSLCPYILDTPAAPNIVAKSENIELEVPTMIRAFNNIKEISDFVVVEGAGGFLVPLNEKENLSDFAQQIDLPVVLVVGMKLGCLNHALLTIESLKSRNLRIAGWVANTLSQQMPLLNENIQTLQSRLSTPFLGRIPQLPADLTKTDHSPYSLEALKFAAQHIQLPK